MVTTEPGAAATAVRAPGCGHPTSGPPPSPLSSGGWPVHPRPPRPPTSALSSRPSARPRRTWWGPRNHLDERPVSPAALRPGAIVGRRSRRPSVVVLGDLMLDAVLKPSHPMVRGTDVPGRVMLRQGGSAANAARWLGRLGVRVQLICAVGRDGVGRVLVDTLQRDGVVVRAARVRRLPTGRIGVVVSPGSRDGRQCGALVRGGPAAADALTRADVKSAWFRGVDVLHLPAYSLLGEPR